MGALSNLSAVVDREPRPAGNIARLAVMGGAFSRSMAEGPSFGPADDHNLNVDPRPTSERYRDLPIVYVPWT